MSQNPGGAPAPGPQAPDIASLDLSKFFGPAAEPETPDTTVTAIDETAGTVTMEKPAAPAPTPDPAPEVKNEIAEALNEWRAEKKIAESAKQEASSWREKHDAVMQELETERSKPAFEDDPIAYIRARKLSPEKQAELVQLLAYDLAPEKAPTDFRFKILEARQREEKAREKAEREAQAAQAAQAETVQKLNAFIGGLDAAAASFEPGSYPANEDWYGENRQAYVTDLYYLANELAEEATAKGLRADLAAATLAAKLEQRNAEKLAALESRRGKRQPKAAPVKPADVVMQNDGGPVSTQGLNTGGPRPPAQSDEERVRRATAAAFGGR